MNEQQSVRLFAPIQKVETTKDGGREIWAWATLERVDKTGEIADFNGTVEAFERWANETAKRTQGKSLGNVRVMHQAIPAGKMTHWEPGETTIQEGDTERTVKGIWTASYIPPHKTDIIRDIDEGILSGVSIGGQYAKRWYSDEDKAFRFIPELAEYSLVDNPAVPGADIVNVIAKADGPWASDRRNLLKSADEDALHAEAEARAKKFGIAFHDGSGHLTPPKGYPTDDADYGDPVNYAYPLDASRIRAAVAYFNHPDQREKGGYTEEEWAIIGKRIADAANREIGKGHTFEDGHIATDEGARKAEWGALQKRAGLKGELSDSDVRQLLNNAVNRKDPFGSSLWVVDVYSDYCIVEDWDTGEFWQVPYTLTDGAVELGTPTKVRENWMPIEGAKAVLPEMTKVDPNDKAVTEQIAAAEKLLEELQAAQKADEKDGKSAGDKAVDDKIAQLAAVLEELKAAQQKDVKDEGAEKMHEALAVLKGVADVFVKRGAAISAERQQHLHHAIDHIHHALGAHDQEGDAAHVHGEAVEAEKIAGVVLSKMTPGLTADVLAKALEGVAKQADVATITTELAKQTEALAQVESRLKVIEEQPQAGGPFVGTMPGLGGHAGWEGLEKQAVLNLLARTDNAVLKDQLGRALAAEGLGEALAQRPTQPPTRS